MSAGDDQVPVGIYAIVIALVLLVVFGPPAPQRSCDAARERRAAERPGLVARLAMAKRDDRFLRRHPCFEALGREQVRTRWSKTT